MTFLLAYGSAMQFTVKGHMSFDAFLIYKTISKDLRECRWKVESTRTRREEPQRNL